MGRRLLVQDFARALDQFLIEREGRDDNALTHQGVQMFVELLALLQRRSRLRAIPVAANPQLQRVCIEASGTTKHQIGLQSLVQVVGIALRRSAKQGFKTSGETRQEGLVKQPGIGDLPRGIKLGALIKSMAIAPGHAAEIELVAPGDFARLVKQGQ